MITPNQLAKSGTEHGHQAALFAYTAVAYTHGWKCADEWAQAGLIHTRELKPIPAFEWFHAIPNGGSRGDTVRARAIRGSQLKAEGVKKGVADCFLPWPIKLYCKCPAHCDCEPTWYHGLYIEMKKPAQKPKKETSKGGMSNEQIAFKEYCGLHNYGFVTCYSWEEAVEVLKGYINYEVS